MYVYVISPLHLRIKLAIDDVLESAMCMQIPNIAH